MANWLNVEPYRNKNPLQTNSFQLILFTNGKSSYAYFHYFHLTWPNNILHKNIKSGYNLGGSQTCLVQNFMRNKFSLSYSSKMTGEIFGNLMNQSNINKPGSWLFRLDTENGN